MANTTVAKSKAVAKTSAKGSKAAPSIARAYLSQEDVPSGGLGDALKVARALLEQYGGRAATPLDVAQALNVQPSSSNFRMICGASIAYGLTNGGANAQEISLTSIGRRILNPLEEGDDVVAKREAVLKPRVLREFLSKYSGAAFPREDIAINVLKSLGVPTDKTVQVLNLIVENADQVGFFRQIKEKRYVDLGGTASAAPKPAFEEESLADTVGDRPPVVQEHPQSNTKKEGTPPDDLTTINRRVFITHGKNMAFIEPIKKLLGFGELVPVVSVEKQSVSQPVPDKVMSDMRSCSAAIIHVDSELTLIDRDAKEHTVVNPNVLIEIGAAMALFGRRFILLVRDGVKLPSNLQGLYEVRYQGDALDGNATIRLLEAINDIKNNPLPTPKGQ